MAPGGLVCTRKGRSGGTSIKQGALVGEARWLKRSGWYAKLR